jgi:hypothetical protein
LIATQAEHMSPIGRCKLAVQVMSFIQTNTGNRRAFAINRVEKIWLKINQ